MTGAYIGLIAVLIVIFIANQFQQRRYYRIVRDGFTMLDKQGELFDKATRDLLSAAWVKVASNHASYEFDDEALPGLITVTCLECGEVAGTMPNSDAPTLPASLIMGHVEEEFRKSVATGREVAKRVMDEVNAEASAK